MRIFVLFRLCEVFIAFHAPRADFDSPAVFETGPLKIQLFCNSTGRIKFGWIRLEYPPPEAADRAQSGHTWAIYFCS